MIPDRFGKQAGSCRVAGVAFAAGLVVAACGPTRGSHATHAGFYPGHVRSSRCASHWYTGSDSTARFSCSADGYRIAFRKSGQETSRTVIERASRVRVDASLRAKPQPRAHPLLDPGVGCWIDNDHGWIAELGTRSAFSIAEFGSAHALATGADTVVRDLSEWNALSLECAATDGGVDLTLKVNGKPVAHARARTSRVRFDRFGIVAASEAGATLEVRRISAQAR